jgi:hypothetical protein
MKPFNYEYLSKLRSIPYNQLKAGMKVNVLEYAEWITGVVVSSRLLGVIESVNHNAVAVEVIDGESIMEKPSLNSIWKSQWVTNPHHANIVRTPKSQQYKKGTVITTSRSSFSDSDSKVVDGEFNCSIAVIRYML